MKIYTVLYKNDLEGYCICGVFKSVYDANEYIEKRRDAECLYEVEEWNLMID